MNSVILQNDGGLAQLARALHWQCRGHRFESGILHQATGFLRWKGIQKADLRIRFFVFGNGAEAVSVRAIPCFRVMEGGDLRFCGCD